MLSNGTVNGTNTDQRALIVLLFFLSDSDLFVKLGIKRIAMAPFDEMPINFWMF